LDNPADKTVVHLLFANKTVSDILIKEELEAASTDPRIKIYYTLDTVKNYRKCLML
jgi:Oxidoreductase NAD-binding domain.